VKTNLTLTLMWAWLLEAITADYSPTLALTLTPAQTLTLMWAWLLEPITAK